MIIIQVMGGLGNQLQQYALYQKMKHLGKEVKLDISWFEDEKKQTEVLASRKLELRYFENLPMEVCTRQEKEALIGTEDIFGKLKRKFMPNADRRFTESEMYHPEIFELQNAYLIGFWACEKYYADILPDLREILRFPLQKDPEGREKNQKLMAQMAGECSVSIHIRRGDYLDSANASMFGGICTDEYYDSAIRLIKEEYPDARFYLFSDDIPYVREKYRGDCYTVVDHNTGASSFYDIQLMSCCKHNICANSTFSFWGARLNANPDRIMVRPAKHKNSQQAVPERMHDLWYEWELIDEKGNRV